MNSDQHAPDDGERFTLANDPPRLKPAHFGNSDGRQRLLLAGLDCLPGQGELFQTDGEGDGEPQR